MISHPSCSRNSRLRPKESDSPEDVPSGVVMVFGMDVAKWRDICRKVEIIESSDSTFRVADITRGHCSGGS